MNQLTEIANLEKRLDCLERLFQTGEQLRKAIILIRKVGPFISNGGLVIEVHKFLDTLSEDIDSDPQKAEGVHGAIGQCAGCDTLAQEPEPGAEPGNDLVEGVKHPKVGVAVPMTAAERASFNSPLKRSGEKAVSHTYNLSVAKLHIHCQDFSGVIVLDSSEGYLTTVEQDGKASIECEFHCGSISPGTAAMVLSSATNVQMTIFADRTRRMNTILIDSLACRIACNPLTSRIKITGLSDVPQLQAA